MEPPPPPPPSTGVCVWATLGTSPPVVGSCPPSLRVGQQWSVAPDRDVVGTLGPNPRRGPTPVERDTPKARPHAVRKYQAREKMARSRAIDDNGERDGSRESLCTGAKLKPPYKNLREVGTTYGLGIGNPQWQTSCWKFEPSTAEGHTEEQISVYS